eukprot:c24220_g2_i1 orf=171-2240(+)
MQALRRQHGTAQLFLHRLSKHGAQNGCMFSVLKASEGHGERRQRRKRPAYDKYAASVTSFVESYFAAYQSYPDVSAVVRETGGSRSTIKRILYDLESGRNALGCEGPCLKGLDDMDPRHSTCLATNECLPNNNESSKNPAWPVSNEFGQLDSKAVTAAVDTLTDITDVEKDTEDIDISAENHEKKGLSSLPDPALFALLDQAMHSSSKADANKRVAPLMEVLQQKTSGSRRVHLSASRGIENDLSWEKSLLSIMPTSIRVKEEDGLKDVQQRSNWNSMGQAPYSFEDNSKKLPTALNLICGVRLMSSKSKSILNSISGDDLKKALKCESNVFLSLRKKVTLLRSKDNNFAHAILRFKTKKSMVEALKLKTVMIEGEKLFLQADPEATVDQAVAGCSQSAGHGNTSLFQEILSGMVGSPSKGEVVSSQSLSGMADAATNIRVEDDESLNGPDIDSLKSDLRMQADLVSAEKVFQNTISIQDFPSSIPLESVAKFFSVFGMVKISSGNSLTFSKDMVFLEFENLCDKEKALKVQQFIVDGYSFQIRADTPSDLLVVRFESQRSEAKHRMVVDACKKYGAVKNIYVRKGQMMDVNFGAHEKDRAMVILDSLNGDESLRGFWKASIVCEGYRRVNSVNSSQASPKETKHDINKLVVMIRELVAYITSMYTTKDGILNQLAAHVESMKDTTKDA